MMTDNQLCVFLLGLIREAESELENVRALMPDDAERGVSGEWRWVGEGRSPLFAIFPQPPDWEWREQPLDYVALQPLVDMLGGWRKRADDLIAPHAARKAW